MLKLLSVTTGHKISRNGNMHFVNCQVLHDTETGMVCARLGLDHTQPASFSFTSKSVEVEARVRRSIARSVCQDSAIIIITPTKVVAGVFDGYGPAGVLVSENAADIAIRLLRDDVVRCNPLFDIAKELSDLGFYISDSVDKNGGTTAALVSVSDEDGGFCAYGAGDSAIYRLRRNVPNRLLNYSFDCKGDRIDGKRISEHLSTRHVVSADTTLSFEPPKPGIRYERSGGLLDRGDAFLVASDWLTKNLAFSFNPETEMMIEVSGCEDLKHILSRRHKPSIIVPALLDAIDQRINLGCEDLQVCSKSTAVRPEDDDVALVAARFHRFQENI
jgi:serine/threonine protein phosphatase PrpC